MRNSQRAVLALLGVIVGLMVIVAIWVRVTAPELPQLWGERTTRTYDFTDFDGVEVKGQWQVTIERGDAWRISVEMPAEIVDQVRVQRDGGTLQLGYQGRWLGDFDSDDSSLQATITMPELRTLNHSGMSRLSFSGFDGSSLSIDASGAGEIRGAASRFDSLLLDMSGFGNIELGDVAVTNADVDLSGFGNVTLRMAGGRLRGDLSGLGNLEYYGSASEENVEKSGFGSIRRRN
jgi:putative autotransporter adhesin-like protein